MARDHRRVDTELPQEILLADLGFLRQIVGRVVQQIYRTKHIGVAPCERAEGRTGHPNGHKPRTLRTRVGTLSLLISQDTKGLLYKAL